MWPDRVSNPGPPTYESGVLLIALCGPAHILIMYLNVRTSKTINFPFGTNGKFIVLGVPRVP